MLKVLIYTAHNIVSSYVGVIQKVQDFGIPSGVKQLLASILLFLKCSKKAIKVKTLVKSKIYERPTFPVTVS